LSTPFFGLKHFFCGLELRLLLFRGLELRLRLLLCCGLELRLRLLFCCGLKLLRSDFRRGLKAKKSHVGLMFFP